MKRVLVLVGPTAVGKTDLAVELAKNYDSEIISADSRQVYRYMDICTAKPTVEQRSIVHHHFIDHISPDANYSAGVFGEEARACIETMFSKGKKVIIVGGSGLYIRAALDGFIAVPKDEDIRRALKVDLEQFGIQHLHDRLSVIDPVSARMISNNDYMRIERALEIYELTGIRKSDLVNVKPDLTFEPVFVGLRCDRAILYARIEMRIDKMIAEGVLEETKGLLEMGYQENLSSMQSLGYRQMTEYLKGNLSYIDMLRLFKQESRNYAKRQLTWFRKDNRIKWFDTTIPQDRIVSELVKYLQE